MLFDSEKSWKQIQKQTDCNPVWYCNKWCRLAKEGQDPAQRFLAVNEMIGLRLNIILATGCSCSFPNLNTLAPSSTPRISPSNRSGLNSGSWKPWIPIGRAKKNSLSVFNQVTA